MSSRLLLAGALLLLPGASGRADSIEVSSTTALVAGRQPRAGAGGGVSLSDTATAFELLSLSARDVANPLVDDLRLAVSAWGAYEVGEHRRWDAGAGSSRGGDLQAAHVEGRLFRRRVTFRLGRTTVSAGAGQVVQLDGGELAVRAPLGLSLSAYAGAPVAQRFSSRAGERSWNPVGGELAVGGRAGWSLALPGLAGRGVDVGAFANVVRDGGDPVREEAGLDLRLQPFGARGAALAGVGAYSLYDERLSHASASLTVPVRRDLELSADWRFTAPDTLLSRRSVLSVFSASEWTELGGGVAWDLSRALSLGAGYHALLEPGEDGEDAGHLGSDVGAWLRLARGGTVAGLEASYLTTFDNGAVAGRVYGRQALGPAFVTADVSADLFRHAVADRDHAISGNVSAGLDLGGGFGAALSARAGVNPHLEQTFDLMAKLEYRQTFRRTEVRP